MAIFKTSRWYMEYDAEKDGSLPDGGIILRNVRHDNYNLAKEIRVIGFWIEFETFTNGKSTAKQHKFFALNKATFTYGNQGKPLLLDERSDSALKKIKDLKSKKLYDKQDKNQKKKYDSYINILDNLQNFSKYHFIKGIQEKYLLKSTFDFENCEFSGVNITQTYLFTDYQDRPAHEPSGALKAARLFPLVKTEFTKNQDFKPKEQKVTRINSIRIDYKFHPALDTYLFDSDTQEKINQANNQKLEGMVNGLSGISKDEKAEALYILKNKPQQAGVFIDEESVDYPSGGLYGPQEAVFKAAEKPLVYEIGGVGLAKGMPAFSDKDQKAYKTWDNIHWWGGYKKTHIPSAPGAFHALHLHWRWGGAVKKTSDPASPKYGNDSQFSSSGVPSEVLKDKRYKGLLGPLVHPDCWIQSIRFAVVKHTDKTTNTTTKEFRDKFADKIDTPSTNLKKIDQGDNILLWYSIEIHKKVTLPGYTTEDISLAPGNTRVNIPEKELTGKLNGTVFIHGMFFAHEQEKTVKAKTFLGVKIETTGSQTEEYFPNEKNTIIKEKKFIRDVEY
ncbi:hypothetical protein [Fluviicola sp.]|uniref:hypothetical protein n=1 Tax=Fluviicola sp. TaxID=1917219 RepID=UPI0031D26C24